MKQKKTDYVRLNAFITTKQKAKLDMIARKQKKQDPGTTISSVVRRALEAYFGQ